MPTTLKTWPYGTKRRAMVCIAKWRPNGLPDHAPSGQLLKDEFNEMHVCIGDMCGDFTAKEGDTGTLTFTEGGPKGGYWKFVKDEVQQANHGNN